jgi:hypothetical protein
MPSILDRKACSRSGATIGWSAGGELIRGTGLTMIEHPESHEICRRGASTYFYFEDELVSISRMSLQVAIPQVE